MSDAIEISDLTKTFGTHAALDRLSMSVARGEVHGFLGPNGAGKSTTIRVLLGQLRKTSGEARVLGRDPWTDAAEIHGRIAYVPGDVALWPNLSGGETIDLLMRLGGNGNAKRRDQLIDRFDLDPTKKGRTYSKGNRQKVAIVAAFSRPAELIILDEPTSGLDPLMERHFQDTLSEAKADGATVLLSSHILSEVERACDRISIIRAGVIVESGTMAELRHLTRTTVHAEVDGEIQQIADMPGVHDLTVDGSHLAMSVDDSQMGEVMRRLAALGIRSLESKPPSLEELFLRHYGDDLASSAPPAATSPTAPPTAPATAPATASPTAPTTAPPTTPPTAP